MLHFISMLDYSTINVEDKTLKWFTCRYLSGLLSSCCSNMETHAPFKCDRLYDRLETALEVLPTSGNIHNFTQILFCWSTTIQLCITYCYNFGCSDKYIKGNLFFLVLTYGYWALANKDFCRRNSDLIAAPLESGEKGLLCSNHSLIFSWRSNGKDIILCSNHVLHPIITNGICIITLERKHPEVYQCHLHFNSSFS